MLVDGEIDSAVGVESNIAYLGYTKPQIPVKCLFSFEKRSADNILIRKQTQLPKNLIGTTIGVLPRTSGHTFMMRFVEHNKIDKNSFRIKSLTPPAIPPAFIRGEIDACALWHPYTHNIILAMDELGQPFTKFDSTDIYQSEVIFATNKTFMIKHKTMIESFLHALKDAEGYLKTNPEKAFAILAEKMKISGKGYKEVLEHFHPSLDKITPAYIENITLLGKWIRENDTEYIGKDLPDYNELVDNEIFLDFRKKNM